jgi:hypothetical protein
LEKAVREAKNLEDNKRLSPPDEAKLGNDQKEPIRFTDAVGRKFFFPWHLCKTWKVII